MKQLKQFAILALLKARDDAEVGEHGVTIAADAPGISENTQTFKLMVKDKS